MARGPESQSWVSPFMPSATICKRLKLPAAWSLHLLTKSENTYSDEFGGDFKDQK